MSRPDKLKTQVSNLMPLVTPNRWRQFPVSFFLTKLKNCSNYLQNGQVVHTGSHTTSQVLQLDYPIFPLGKSGKVVSTREGPWGIPSKLSEP